MRKIILLNLLLLIISVNSIIAQNFTQITNFPDPEKTLTWVFSTSATNAYITAFDTKSIYRTIDGGVTWESVVVSNVLLDFTDVYFTNANDGWVVAGVDGQTAGKLFKTNDGGATWQDLSSNVPDISSNPLSSIRMNGNNGIIGCAAGEFTTTNFPNYYLTTDGGNTWIAKNLPNPNIPFVSDFEIFRVSSNTESGTFQISGRAGGSTNIIYNSTNNGASFSETLFDTQGIQNSPFDIFNIDDTVYWIPTLAPEKSTNGGSSWSSFSYHSNSPNMFSGFFETPNKGWIVGANSSIYSTENGAISWTELQNIDGQPILRDIFMSDGIIWAVGENSAIYKSESILGVDDFQTNNFKLNISPNPTTGIITINNKSKNIALYDISGKKMAFSIIKKDENQTQIDITNLNTGIYFLQIAGMNNKTKFIKQ